MRLIVVAACCLVSCCAAVWPPPKAPDRGGPVREANAPKFSKELSNVKSSPFQGKSIGDEASYSIPLGSSKNKGKENSADTAATKNGNSSIGSISEMLGKVDLSKLDLNKVKPANLNMMGMQGGSNNRRSPSRNEEESPDEPTWDRNSPYQIAADRGGSDVNSRSQYQNPGISKKGIASINVQPRPPGSGKAANNVGVGKPGAPQKKAGSFSPTTPPLKSSNQGKKQQQSPKKSG